MPGIVLPALIGLGAGILSGMFGVGGGVLTTPALRLLLDAPALVAVGTPLPVIIPTAAAGAYAYARRDLADIRAGVAIGAWGAVVSIGGAFLSDLVGGSIVMFITAAIILVMAADMAAQATRRTTSNARITEQHPRRGVALALLGVATGVYSGFLGLGGGFVLVPLLVRWFGYPIKRAIGTSLVSIAILAIPGSLTHYLLGHVDVGLTLALMIGVVPGAILGARLTAISSERAVKIGFALLLAFTGVVLAVNEMSALL